MVFLYYFRRSADAIAELTILPPPARELAMLIAGQAAIASTDIPVSALYPLTDRPGTTAKLRSKLIVFLSEPDQFNHLLLKLRRIRPLLFAVVNTAPCDDDVSTEAG